MEQFARALAAQNDEMMALFRRVQAPAREALRVREAAMKLVEPLHVHEVSEQLMALTKRLDLSGIDAHVQAMTEPLRAAGLFDQWRHLAEQGNAFGDVLKQAEALTAPPGGVRRLLDQLQPVSQMFPDLDFEVLMRRWEVDEPQALHAQPVAAAPAALPVAPSAVLDWSLEVVRSSPARWSVSREEVIAALRFLVFVGSLLWNVLQFLSARDLERRVEFLEEQEATMPVLTLKLDIAAALRVLPTRRAEAVTVLRPGTEVRALDEIDGWRWVEVTIDDGPVRGWLPEPLVSFKDGR